MNWDDLRYFLELARQKRLSRAGRRLGVDHTTVARRIEQLETDLGCRLFESTVEGYVPTDAGQRLLSHAESVESSVQLLGEEARGQELQAGGTVRIGAPEGFGTAFLMPRMNRLMEDHPELNIELLTLPRFPNLATREADLIVTLDPPRQGRYIATRLTDFSYGLFASRDYLARHGPVRSRAALAGHRLVGYIDEMLPSPQLNYLDQLMPKHPLRIASSGMLAQLAAVRAGSGCCGTTSASWSRPRATGSWRSMCAAYRAVRRSRSAAAPDSGAIGRACIALTLRPPLNMAGEPGRRIEIPALVAVVDHVWRGEIDDHAAIAETPQHTLLPGDLGAVLDA